MEQIKATELGSKPIGSLLLHYAIPAIIAMTAASLYNIVDSIFIGHGVGPLAISGLAVTFPLMNLTAAFGTLIGVGAATFISVKLGERDYNTSQHILGNVVVLSIIIGIVLSIVALLFLNPILLFFGASENTLPYARDYMLIILAGNTITYLYFGLNALLRSIGHPRRAMMTTIFTVVLNTLLDPLFIYVFDWGIGGAAIATVLSQLVALIGVIHLFTNRKEVIYFRKGIYRLSRYIVTSILNIGLSPFSMNVAACIIVILINKGLKHYEGDLAIGAYGIINRVVFIFIMIVLGLNQGMQPIAGYNFGARQYHRVNKVMLYTCIVATIVTTSGFLLSQLAAPTVVSAFTTDERLISLSVEGLKIVTWSFPLVGFQMVTSNFFQCINMAKKAIILSLSRQVLILIPCLFILPLYFGAKGIWISMPLADTLSAILAAIFLIKQMRVFHRNAHPSSNEN